MASLADQLPEQNIDRENSTRIVWALAWPAVALNSLQVINTLLDRFFVGHLPEAALTAQGGAINVMFLMFSLAMALATGATALVARAYGADQPSEYRMASRQALNLTLFFGFGIGLLTAAIAPFVAQLVLPNDAHEAAGLMKGFLLAYAAGLPGIYLIQTLAGSLRGIGDTKSPMVISGFQILLHIALNFVLIFPTRTIQGITIPGMDWGLVGAAASLSISAWVSAIIYLLYTARTPLGSLFSFSFPKIDWARRILRIAAPAALMAVLRVLSLTMFTLILAGTQDGKTAIAAMSIGFGIEAIMFMPAFGLSMAAGALVGQSLGMKRPERAERLGWVASHYGALVTVLLVLPIFIFAPQIGSLLTDNKAAITAAAAELIRYLCVTEIFFAYAMVLIGAMQGAGDTVRPFWISVFALWFVRLPLAFLLAMVFKLGPTGAWIAMSVTQGIQGIMAIVAFKRGAWKSKVV